MVIKSKRNNEYFYGDFAYHPMAMEYQPDIKPYTGACIPGEKLYVTVDGTFKICEKVNSSYTIGNVQYLDCVNYATKSLILQRDFRIHWIYVKIKGIN